MKKLNKVNTKRNDTIVAFGCYRNCTTVTNIVTRCNVSNGTQKINAGVYQDTANHAYIFHK